MRATINEMEKGTWYRIDLYGGSKMITITEPTGEMIRTLGARGLSGSAQRFRAITEDGQTFTVSPLDIGRRGIGMLTPVDLPASTPEDVKEFIRRGEVKKAEAEIAAILKEERKREEREALPGRYPYLIPEAESGKSPWAAAAANVRKELKRAFPKTKFSVTSKSYTGGSSLDIRWEDGPTSRQVDALVKKYEYGNFDGMTDTYSYDEGQFSRVFGGAKYVLAERGDTAEGIRRSWATAGNDPEEVIIGKDGNWDRWAQESETGDAMRRAWSDTEL